MNKSPQPPEWIIERYQQCFHAHGMAPPLLTLAMSIISEMLPPPTRPDLQQAAELYARDHGVSIPEALTDTFANLASLAETPWTTSGTQYPLWYALSQPRFLNRQQAGALTARQLLQEWFTPVVRGVVPGIYATQVRHVRDILVLVLDDAELHGIPLYRYDDVIRIMGHPVMQTQRREASRQYQTVVELYEERRRPGVRVGNDLSGYPRSGRLAQRPRQLNPYQVSRREQIADAPLAPQCRVTETPGMERASGGEPLGSELSERGYRYARHTASHRDTADTPDLDIPVLERATPSQLTPADDRRAARQAVQMAATQTLATQEDVHRLTPWQIQQVLSLPLPPAEWVLIRLLLVTGMPVSRLITLQRSPHDSESTADAPADPPQWHPASATWRYRLRDGPSPAPDGSTAHLWVTLRLPEDLNDALLSIASETPLAGSTSRLNRHLRRAFGDTPGITPTAERLAATSALLMRPLAPDNHAVLTLKGQYGMLDAAPAAYRQLDGTSLQQLFDAGMSRCGIRTLSSPPAPASAQPVGSCRALTASAWQSWTTRLQEAIAQAREPLDIWLPPTPLPIASVVAYVQLVTAYTYLGWLLATGARPASANTHTIITGTRAWIRDKGSRRGTESRVIPLHASIMQQLQSHRALVEQTLALMTRHEYPIEDQRRPDQQGPTWFSLTQHRRPHCQLRAIRHADLRQVLSRLIDEAPRMDALLPADNATRHSTTTALYRTIPEAELDALVGHARIGRDRTHPRANAPLHQNKACQDPIGAWLKATGYRVLDVETPPWQ
ncbi:hypothetical protein [Halomonas sp. JS92-SW72]|uniref:hypothetical protein n=1 Tax=Halomonas sp. JS92-SW72 TaxID=2306583 RepID=UPI000E5BD696|nr:hypothetical protein [Halomonas sp. JS92-SW72]AXY43944.1 hypothetical protein D1793_18090 [Halomonas sp. JS92-SW72]